MTIESTITAGLVARESGLNLRDSLSRTFDNARMGSPRWQELDVLWSRTVARIKGTSQIEGDAICREVIDQIEHIAELDHRDREAERLKPNLAYLARLDAQRRQNQQAWADRVSAPIRAALRTLKDRADRANERVSAASSEAEIREVLGDIADAVSAMGATLGLESRASIDREAAAEKAAAA